MISDPATVEAVINLHALKDKDLIEKIIEARDVLAAFEQKKRGLRFKYPDWMVGSDG